ncbi:glycosyltransferase family 4 protein [Leuconostoc citreum]|uniref:glycosyltransferase family 4 protein n=1 Tax=Leuconostoc citreum TaxID=33964 RepID=UPI0021A323D9|nr:glycosyltransferase family 4 protein [Leuconostoc citreum]MCT3057821.1 glycosyltransferase [Leuconostoc citreum]MCT3073640.1 glycosyltransferase [Leuconostoc citreum]MDM7641798.1 glycosyltransferase family 4 protein [Leuconostoc citreum]
MKIIITVNTYYPFTDGVQSVTQYQAEGLIKLGHEVTVVTVMHEGMKKIEWHNGVKIIRYNIQTKHAFHLGDKSGYRSLIISLCKNSDVLINVCTQTATTEVLFPILTKINITKILYMHGMHDFSWHQANLLYSIHKIWNDIRWGWDYLVNGRYFKKYNKVIQLHKFDSATLFFKKIYNIDSLVVENAAEDIFFKHSTNKDSDYILNVSNFDKRKNQELILEAFYKSKQLNTKLVLVGSRKNKYTKYLEHLKHTLDEKYGNRQVDFLEKVPRKKIAELVQKSRLYLMGSKWEAFPIALVEAMAAGKPFISTDVGIVRYLPGGVTVKNTQEMAYWIDLFLDQNQIADDYGKIGNKYATNNLTIKNKVELLETIIRK